MLPRSACRRGVHRTLAPEIESIWISDEVLSQTYQSFVVVSKAGRRHGSFVPGPMEARRRLGRRRMTLQTDATFIPSFETGTLWRWLGEKDRTKWRWEAPTPSPTKSEPTKEVLLPGDFDWGTIQKQKVMVSIPLPTKNEATKNAVLPGEFNWGPTQKQEIVASIPPSAEFKTILEVISNGIFGWGTTRKQEATAPLLPPSSFGKSDIDAFRLDLGGSGDIILICNQFSLRLKQSLTLGLVSNQILESFLKIGPDAILASEIDPNDVRACCLHLYVSIWEGLKACEVIPLDGVRGKILNYLLLRVSELPMTTKSKNLSKSIACSAAPHQLKKMQDGLNECVVSWLRFIIEKVPLISSTPAPADILDKDSPTGRIQIALSPSTKIFSMPTTRILINQAENLTTDFVKFLKRLPTHMVASSLSSLFRYLCSGSMGERENIKLIYHLFLTVAAQVPAIQDNRFVAFIETSKIPLGASILNRLLVRQFESQACLDELAKVNMTPKFAAPNMKTLHPKNVLFATREDGWLPEQDSYPLIKSLDLSGWQETTYRTARGMITSAGKNLPADSMVEILESVSTWSPRRAYKLYLRNRAVSLDSDEVNLELCPKFMASICMNPEIGTRDVWKLLDVPPYRDSESRWRHVDRQKMISPAMIKLLTTMASAFSYSNRPPRTILRNVERCHYHLLKQWVPVSAEMARAIARAGVAQRVSAGQWVPEARMEWVTKNIAKAEGDQVARLAQLSVESWNASVSEKRHKEIREANPLRLGRIG